VLCNKNLAASRRKTVACSSSEIENWPPHEFITGAQNRQWAAVSIPFPLSVWATQLAIQANWVVNVAFNNLQRIWHAISWAKAQRNPISENDSIVHSV